MHNTEQLPEVSIKKSVPKIWQDSQESTLQLHEKQTPTKIFSCEYCEISKKTYFEEHLRTAASEVTLGGDCLGLSFWPVALKTILTQ